MSWPTPWSRRENAFIPIPTRPHSNLTTFQLSYSVPDIPTADATMWTFHGHIINISRQFSWWTSHRHVVTVSWSRCDYYLKQNPNGWVLNPLSLQLKLSKKFQGAPKVHKMTILGTCMLLACPLPILGQKGKKMTQAHARFKIHNQPLDP